MRQAVGRAWPAFAGEQAERGALQEGGVGAKFTPSLARPTTSQLSLSRSGHIGLGEEPDAAASAPIP